MPRINVDRLALWRAARQGDPVASAAWERLKARAGELEAQFALRRFGKTFGECDFGQRQQLHTLALDVATAEL